MTSGSWRPARRPTHAVSVAGSPGAGGYWALWENQDSTFATARDVWENPDPAIAAAETGTALASWSRWVCRKHWTDPMRGPAERA